MSVASASSLERLQSLTVADVMTRRVTVVPGCARMEEAARILAEAAASGAPVVDAAGRCIGVLSATDFLRFEVEKAGRQPYVPVDWTGVVNCTELPLESVQRFMTPAVQTVSMNESLLKAAEIMCLEHIHRLVVLDEHSAPMGVVSTLDVMSALIAAMDEEYQRRQTQE